MDNNTIIKFALKYSDMLAACASIGLVNIDSAKRQEGFDKMPVSANHIERCTHCMDSRRTHGEWMAEAYESRIMEAYEDYKSCDMY